MSQCNDDLEYAWELYQSLLKIKHPHVKTRYPYNGIDGAAIEHTLNELTLLYEKHEHGKPKFHQKGQQKLSGEKPSWKKKKNYTGSASGTITVYG